MISQADHAERLILLQSELPPVQPVKAGSVTRAIEWLRTRLALTKSQYDALDAEEQQKALLATRSAHEGMAQAVQDELLRSLESGITLDDFHEALEQRFGSDWIGSDKFPPSRVEMTFRTGTATALGRGQWDETTNPDALERRPYFMSVVINDKRTTDICRQCVGLILRHDDPRLRKLWTPRHFQCRCTWRALTEAQAMARGGPSQNVPDIQIPDGFGLQ